MVCFSVSFGICSSAVGDVSSLLLFTEEVSLISSSPLFLDIAGSSVLVPTLSIGSDFPTGAGSPVTVLLLGISIVSLKLSFKSSKYFLTPARRLLILSAIVFNSSCFFAIVDLIFLYCLELTPKAVLTSSRFSYSFFNFSIACSRIIL